MSKQQLRYAAATLIHCYIPVFLSFFLTVKLILEQKYGHATFASKEIP